MTAVRYASVADLPACDRKRLAQCIRGLNHDEDPSECEKAVLGIVQILSHAGLHMADLARHVFDPASELAVAK